MGHRAAVARVGDVTVGGLPAWLLWHGYYLACIPSWRHRLRLATSWVLSALVGRDTGQMDLGGQSPSGTDADRSRRGVVRLGQTIPRGHYADGVEVVAADVYPTASSRT